MPTRKMKPQTNEISCIFWNCASGIFNKKPFIEKYILDHRPSLFFISECNIKEHHMIERLKIRGYSIEVANTISSRGSGRVLVFIQEGSGFTRAPALEESQNDIIVMKSKKLIVAGIYAGFKTCGDETVSSNFSRLLSNLELICNKCSVGLVIGGDFNADPTRPNAKTKALDIWRVDCGVDQCVKDVTRARLVSNQVQMSMIDHVYVRDTTPTIAIHPSEVSDHHLIVCKVKMQPNSSEQPIKFEKKTVIDWRKYNPKRLSDGLEAQVSEIMQRIYTSPDALNRDLESAVSESMNACMPKRTVHLRRETDITNYKVEALKKKRDRLFKMARRTKDPHVMSRVKDLNKDIKKLVKSESERLVKTKMKNCTAKTFWSTVNGLLGKTNERDLYRITDDDGKEQGEEDVAQAFADFFKGKVEQLVSENAIQDEEVSMDYDKIEYFSETEIDKAISTFKPKRSSGVDEIPMLVLKGCYNFIRPIIKKLFDIVVDVGRIPKIWKLARLKPIHKKGDKTKVINYRPISNLCSISKIFERCILNQISETETDGEHQHGFRPGHSTSTAMVEVQSILANELDANKTCLIYSVDLSAAFDLVRPGVFVKKALKVLKEKGLVWLMLDFITERKAFVEVGNSTSMIFKLDVGCPQGSTLGPKIFNIYCHDLVETIKHGTITSYADDSYVIVSESDVGNLQEKAQLQLETHLEWLQNNGMICNVSKTEAMVLSNRPLKEKMTLNVAGTQIKTQDRLKVLGVIFDEKMDWGLQVENVIKRTNKILHGLRGVKKFVNVQQARQIVTAFYFSVLYYGCESWFTRNLQFHHKRKIRSSHYRALRMVYGINLSRDQIDQISQRSTPDEWSDYVNAKMLCRVVITGSPRRLSEMVKSTSYTERRKPGQMFFYDESKKKIGRQCFKNRLCNISKQIKFKWLECPVNSLRPKLKKCFFMYAKD
jgi:hypothetical protein